MGERRHLAGRVLLGAAMIGALVLPFVGGYPLAYGLMVVSLLLILWWLSAGPAWRELREPAGAMMLAAVLLIGLALALTADDAHDLVYVGNFAMVALFPPIRAAMARLASGDAARRVALAALAGSLLAAAVAVLQVAILGLPRAQGFGSDPIWAAQAALLLGLLSLTGLGSAAGAWRHVLLLGPMLGIIAVLLTGSRGPLLAAIAVFAIAVIAATGHRLKIVSATLAAVAVGGLAAALLLGDAGARIGAVQEAVIGAAARDSSIGGRLTLYRAGWEAFSEAPLAGYGWEQRLPAAYGFVPGGEAAIVAADPMMRGNHHLHADILDFGVGTGLLGIAAYLFILLAPLIGAFASPRDGQRPARLLGTAILAGTYLFCGLSYIMIGYEFPTTLYVVIAAILLGYCRDVPSGPLPEMPATTALRRAA